MSLTTIAISLILANKPSSAAAARPQPTPPPTVRRLVDQQHPNVLSLLIEKARYRLTVLGDGKPLKTFPVVFGGNPTDDKLQEGDTCTPLGRFHVKAAYTHAQWSRFIWLDYPTRESWTKHLKAKKDGRIGLLATIGGDVGIHGVPWGRDDLIDQRQNWTLGCISLKSRDVAEVFEVVKPGTLVEIRP